MVTEEYNHCHHGDNPFLLKSNSTLADACNSKANKRNIHIFTISFLLRSVWSENGGVGQTEVWILSVRIINIFKKSSYSAKIPSEVCKVPKDITLESLKLKIQERVSQFRLKKKTLLNFPYYAT